MSTVAKQAASEQVNLNGNDVDLKFYISAQSNLYIEKQKWN